MDNSMNIFKSLIPLCIIFFTLCTASKTYCKDQTATLLAGTSKVDITPPEKDAVNLTGQPLKKRDSLYARVLLLKDREISLAIVSLDLIVFSSKK
jgi:hypothetical protein